MEHHKKYNARKTEAANQKTREIQENLDTIIKCENARLNFNYYERKALEEKISIEDRDKAKKMIETLNLDLIE